MVTSIGQDRFLVNILVFKVVGLLSLGGAGARLWLLFAGGGPGGPTIVVRRAAWWGVWAR